MMKEKGSIGLWTRQADQAASFEQKQKEGEDKRSTMVPAAGANPRGAAPSLSHAMPHYRQVDRMDRVMEHSTPPKQVYATSSSLQQQQQKRNDMIVSAKHPSPSLQRSGSESTTSSSGQQRENRDAHSSSSNSGKDRHRRPTSSSYHDDPINGRQSRHQSGSSGKQQQERRSQSTTRAHSNNNSYGLTSDVMSQEQKSAHSEDLSNYSTQSAPTPQKVYITEYTAERREPSPISFTSVKRDLSRDASPDRSQDSAQYIKITRRIIDDLSRAQGTSRRIAAVTCACEAFDHQDESRHNIELHHGAAPALAKLLEQSRSTDDELRMICSALEMIFRGSSKAVQEAYKKLPSNFLSRLLRVLESCEERSMKHADISILNISKMIFYFSKCSELRVMLCQYPEMERFLSRVATGALNPDCRALRMRILANLCAAEKNKTVVWENKSIVDAILRVAHMDTYDLARQHAAVVLQEMASSAHNHITMASNDQLLSILVKMALVEKSLVARDAVISALQTLAFTKLNRPRLVKFKDGVILEGLKRTLTVDPDDKIRRRSAGTLTNLVCEETAEVMGSHTGLLEALAIIATKDLNTEVQTRAALALTKIGSSINHGMKCFNTLLDALVVASLSKTSNSVTAILRLKAREPQNRQPMAQHKGVLDTLTDICVSPSATVTDRDNAMRALMHLINDDGNRKLMCTKVILHALVTGANMDDDQEECRESAIRALERLATEISNRPLMARHPGLLQAVAKAVEREVKLEDSKIESEHGYLAKPLLMTLLMQM